MLNKPIIALTMGDPGGIGPEILVKALQKEKLSKRLAYLLIGSRQVFKTLCQKTGLWLSFQTTHSVLPGSLRSGNIYFLDILPGPSSNGRFRIGKLCRENARLALLAIEKAASLAKQGIIDAIVTAGGIPQSGDPLYAYSNGDSKALIDVAGKPMIQWVLDALGDKGEVTNELERGAQALLAVDQEGFAVQVFAIP